MIEVVTPPVAKVELISHTISPVRVIATVARTFEGELSTELTSMSYENKVLEQLQKTELQGPLEMVNFVWLISDVTRAFTHQIVRYRIGTSFSQESLRFSNKTDAKVLDTTGGNDDYLLSVQCALRSYHNMVESGVPIQDARGILPTNILTSLFFSCSLRTLINIYRQRVCEQAQHGEWEVVLGKMKKLIEHRIDPRLAGLLKMSCEDGGKCLFESIWDRPCPRREQHGSGTTTGANS